MEINKEDISWLAGIIDGEGSLTLTKSYGSSTSLRPRLQIGNTDMELLKEVTRIYVGLGIRFYVQLHNPNKRFPTAKRYLTINVEGCKVISELLPLIEDKMRSGQKIRQVAHIKEYITYRNISLKNKELRTIEKDEWYAKEMKEIYHYQVQPSTTKRKASTELSW